MTVNIESLRSAIPSLPAHKREFAESLVAQWAVRRLSSKQYFWACKLVRMAEEAAPQQASVPVEPTLIDGIEGVAALLKRAHGHLKAPNIVLTNMRRAADGTVERIPGLPDALRIGFDKEGDKIVVRLNDTWSIIRTGRGRYGRAERKRAYLGRIFEDGKYEPFARNGVDLAVVIERLRELAADPARVAREHALLTGRCCFCNTKLEDERSTAAGYGYVCAHHYGMPWGDRPEEFAAPAEAMVAARMAREDADID